MVFDGATSSLDTTTEQALMESINQLSEDLTIVMIAHRLSTLQCCDRIVRLAQGAVVVEGPLIRFYQFQPKSCIFHSRCNLIKVIEFWLQMVQAVDIERQLFLIFCRFLLIYFHRCLKSSDLK